MKSEIRVTPRAPFENSQHAEAIRAGKRRYAKERRDADIGGIREALAQDRKERPVIVAKMSEFIIARAAGQEACTEQHLRTAGYSEDDIRRFLPAALKIAGKAAPGLKGGL